MGLFGSNVMRSLRLEGGLEAAGGYAVMLVAVIEGGGNELPVRV